MRGVPLKALLFAAVAAAVIVPGTARAATISVAQFNCDISDEYPRIPAPLVARAIRASGADVAGIEEGGGEIPQIARALHWRYYDIRMQIVSRLPLIDPPAGNGIAAFVRVAPGRVVALENVHLPAEPYGPSWVARGRPAHAVLAMERRVRLPAIQPALRAARRLRAEGIPVFLTGDFNSPSFLDWTPAAVGTRPGLDYPLRWPVSAAIVHAGFTDSFRAVHPDPVRTPGLTWPSHRTLPGVENFDGAPKDRIDIVYAAGARALAARVVGEPGAPGVSATVAPWPSDHRLVVSTFRVRGAAPPALVSAPRRVVVGSAIRVLFHAPGRGERTVAVERLRGGRGIALARRRVAAGPGIGAAGFATGGWRPGAYTAALRSAGGRVLARFPFWVVPAGARPTVTTSRATYAHGQPVRIIVRNAPGERWDWLGIYHRGANPLVAYYLMWRYTHAAIDGTFRMGARPVPLPRGRYTVYLLRDDLYVAIAGADFTVR